MAQLVARLNGIEKVEGSSPSGSTKIFRRKIGRRVAGRLAVQCSLQRKRIALLRMLKGAA